MTKQVIYREDETIAANLEVVAKQNGRTVSDEVRAATDVYIQLINLGHLRILHPRGASTAQLDDVERQVKDYIGRVLMAALGNDVVSRFENDAGVEYPKDRFGQIYQPFEKLLDWIVSGDA